MDSVDVEVLSAAIDWQHAGATVLLATVVRTWGSAPRPVGSLLAVRSDGVMKGSVSGGCIEDDLGERARNGILATNRPEVIRYGVTADEAHRFGLPCGGTLELVVEPLHAESKVAEVLASIVDGKTVVRTLDVLTGKSTLQVAHTVCPPSFNGHYLQTVHGPQLCVVLIGASQLAEYVARFAVALGYKVIVCDPREEYKTTWDVFRTEFTSEMPDDLLLRIGVDCNTAVVTLTHDPKLDDMTLLEALKSDAFYVGAIGSRANSERRKDRLKLFDLTQDQIDRLHAPVGLYIGAQTPPEIAVSIIAEITAVRHHVPVLQQHSMREVHEVALFAVPAA